MPTARFSAASRLMKIWILFSTGRSEAAISPPMRPAPTMPIGPLGSRFSPENAAFHTPTIFLGMLTIATAVRSVRSHICPTT